MSPGLEGMMRNITLGGRRKVVVRTYKGMLALMDSDSDSDEDIREIVDDRSWDDDDLLRNEGTKIRYKDFAIDAPPTIDVSQSPDNIKMYIAKLHHYGCCINVDKSLAFRYHMYKYIDDNPESPDTHTYHLCMTYMFMCLLSDKQFVNSIIYTNGLHIIGLIHINWTTITGMVITHLKSLKISTLPETTVNTIRSKLEDCKRGPLNCKIPVNFYIEVEKYIDSQSK